jgi:hypothetical protein
MPLPQRSRIETLAGRSLAMCAHPYAAWRTLPGRVRTFLVLAYAAASYAVVLAALATL